MRSLKKKKKKFKIKISAITITMAILLNGCGEKIVNEYGNKVAKIGPYIEITCQDGRDSSNNYYYFRTMYHEKTKIVYYITTSNYRFDITEAHGYDEEGHPVLLFYHEGKIVKKNEIYN